MNAEVMEGRRVVCEAFESPCRCFRRRCWFRTCDERSVVLARGCGRWLRVLCVKIVLWFRLPHTPHAPHTPPVNLRLYLILSCAGNAIAKGRSCYSTVVHHCCSCVAGRVISRARAYNARVSDRFSQP